MAIDILVVEDDPFLTAAYKAKLATSGYNVHFAMDGGEALAELKKFTPDVILLDLLMPRVDGFTFIEKLRAQHTLQNVPIVVATNLNDPHVIEHAKALGIVDYIIKSDVSFDELVSKIEKALERYAKPA